MSQSCGLDLKDVVLHLPGGDTAISVVNAVEHRDIHSITDEDPLLQEGLFERFPDRDLEGFPWTYPARHRNSTTKTATMKDWPNGALAKKSNNVSARKKTRRISVKEVRMIRSQPILDGTLKAPGCDTFRARPSVSRIYGRKQCKMQRKEESVKNN